MLLPDVPPEVLEALPPLVLEALLPMVVVPVSPPLQAKRPRQAKPKQSVCRRALFSYATQHLQSPRLYRSRPSTPTELFVDLAGGTHKC